MQKAFLFCFALLLLGFAASTPSTAASCCPVLCTTNSSCDATCGVGLGTCVGATTCCRVCLCSLAGT